MTRPDSGLTMCDFYPRPPRGGRPELRHGCRRGCPISIHALREEGDIGKKEDELLPVLFLSTPSARRATRRCLSLSNRLSNFYPRPPRGGRHESATVTFKAKEFLSTPSARRATLGGNEGHLYHDISIHALREEGDPDISRAGFMAWVFLSTPSARRATQSWWGSRSHRKISIHALREEGDQRGSAARLAAGYFYPRPPRGGRLKRGKMHPAPCKFLSTPSARRATWRQTW